MLIILTPFITGAFILMFIYHGVMSWKKRQSDQKAAGRKAALVFSVTGLVVMGMLLPALFHTERGYARVYHLVSQRHGLYFFTLPGYERGYPSDFNSEFSQSYRLKSDKNTKTFYQIDVKQYSAAGISAIESCQKQIIVLSGGAYCEEKIINGVKVSYAMSKKENSSFNYVKHFVVLGDTSVELFATRQLVNGRGSLTSRSYKLDDQVISNLIESASLYKYTLIQRILTL